MRQLIRVWSMKIYHCHFFVEVFGEAEELFWRGRGSRRKKVRALVWLVDWLGGRSVVGSAFCLVL